MKGFYKEKKGDKVWWVDDPDVVGPLEISFDRKKIDNLFVDYPHNLSAEERAIFDSENPYWADFFKDRV